MPSESMWEMGNETMNTKYLYTAWCLVLVVVSVLCKVDQNYIEYWPMDYVLT